MVHIHHPTEPVLANQKLPRGLLENKQNQIPIYFAATCKFNTKSSVSPKIANNVSMESLKSLEHKFAVISHCYCTKV
jgi:hypothetical protein